jgi:hypothetical protein
VAAPTVTAVSPTSGAWIGGTSVTVTGTNFTGLLAVSFGGIAASAITVNSATQLTVTAKAAVPGTFDVIVTTGNGPSATSAADQFSYTAPVPVVTGLSPTSGSRSGGTTVVISGSGFTGTTSVFFGTLAATQVTVNTDSQVTATSPALETTGTVDVTVTTGYGGTSLPLPPDQFTYVLPQFFDGPVNNGASAVPKGQNLTEAELRPIVGEAVADLGAAGFDVAGLAQSTFHITSLPGLLLGATVGNSIWIDETAKGYGWYTAVSGPWSLVVGNEYRAAAGSPAAGQVDLLTVVTHELGHVLGLDSIDPATLGHDWMTATLGTGLRRYPDRFKANAVLSAAGSTLDDLPGRELGSSLQPAARPATLRAIALAQRAFADQQAPAASADGPELLRAQSAALLELPTANAAPSALRLGLPVLIGSDGSPLLVGGAGHELVIGNAGRSVMIGGFDTTLSGPGGHGDILPAVADTPGNASVLEESIADAAR